MKQPKIIEIPVYKAKTMDELVHQILKYIQVIRSKVSKETVIPMFPRFISMRLHQFKMKYDLKTILQ